MSTPLHWIVAALVTLGVGAFAAHDANQAEAEPTPSDLRKARAADAVCREAFGPEALHFWTPEGHLVCRRGKPLT